MYYVPGIWSMNCSNTNANVNAVIAVAKHIPGVFNHNMYLIPRPYNGSRQGTPYLSQGRSCEVKTSQLHDACCIPCCSMLRMQQRMPTLRKLTRQQHLHLIDGPTGAPVRNI